MEQGVCSTWPGDWVRYMLYSANCVCAFLGDSYVKNLVTCCCMTQCAAYFLPSK